MFIGEFSHSLDEKGRVNVPAKFRKGLVKGLVVTRGIDRCLSVYPRDEWQQIAGKLASLPLSQHKSRAFTRLILAGAWDANLDSQGRIVLPEYLRKYASLTKHVIVAGLYNRFEIWDEDAWNEYRAKAEKDSENIAEALTDLGV